ncbi:MAG: preprotein translocase subunit SecE [Puniceicoccales bacterium]|jgi:preprotein translocase SecE subunit|nr:preprotein translocase subunit SecE [Puniceicoccales bacterium]
MSNPVVNAISKTRQFWNEIVSECWTKAVWPTPKELVQSTGVVVVFIALLSACVFVFDFSMHELVRFVTRQVAAQ